MPAHRRLGCWGGRRSPSRRCCCHPPRHLSESPNGQHSNDRNQIALAAGRSSIYIRQCARPRLDQKTGRDARNKAAPIPFQARRAFISRPGGRKLGSALVLVRGDFSNERLNKALLLHRPRRNRGRPDIWRTTCCSDPAVSAGSSAHSRSRKTYRNALRTTGVH
jgi:hypothetical protein